MSSALLPADEIATLRAGFPLLAGQPDLAYLDWAATAQRPAVVLDAERDFLQRSNGAVHRGAHRLAGEASLAFEDARETVARFVGADADEVIWQAGATDAINTVATGMLHAGLGLGGPEAERFRLGAGDEIVVTEAEHHANLVPWQQLAAATGASLRFIAVDEHGLWDAAAAAAVIGPATRVVAFAHVGNVTGMVAPVAEVVDLAHGHGALVVLDACQSAPHRPLRLRELDVDFAAFSGHKLGGPNGIGVLVGRRELLNALPPARTGGSMITTVTMESSRFMPAPHRFEAGTQPVSQAIGLAAAVGWLDSVGLQRIHEHEAALAQRLLAGLAEIDGVTVFGPAAGVERGGLVAFDVAGVHAHDVGQFLDAADIAVRVGHHCAQPLHRRLGVAATVRASVAATTTPAEVDRLVSTLARVRDYFGANA